MRYAKIRQAARPRKPHFELSAVREKRIPQRIEFFVDEPAKWFNM